MTSQGIWVGIAVGVFFAGLGIGYAVFNSSPVTTVSSQQMQTMMNDPQFMNQWQQTMMQNPQAMNSWMSSIMSNPETMQTMMNQMMQSPQAGQWMMGQMMNDPQLSQQMYDTMLQHNQFMQGMMNDPNFQNEWMGQNQGMMGSGMMGGMMVGQGMMTSMQDPKFREQMTEQMLENQQFMQELRQNSQFMAQITTSTLTKDIAITEKELTEQLSDESVLLLDIRDIEQFDKGHISGAATATCAEDKREKVISRIPKSVKIILVDHDGTQSPEMVQLLLDAGLDAKYLEGGMNMWKGNLVQDPGATQITPKQLWSRIQQNDNLYLLDVRTPQEFLEYHIPGSVNIPLEYTFDAETTSMIPNDKDIIVICKSGTRATVASFALAKHGISGEILDGGIVAWLDYLNSTP